LSPLTGELAWRSLLDEIDVWGAFASTIPLERRAVVEARFGYRHVVLSLLDSRCRG
jgi:hypothetical protein